MELLCVAFCCVVIGALVFGGDKDVEEGTRACEKFSKKYGYWPRSTKDIQKAYKEFS